MLWLLQVMYCESGLHMGKVSTNPPCSIRDCSSRPCVPCPVPVLLRCSGLLQEALRSPKRYTNLFFRCLDIMNSCRLAQACLAGVLFCGLGGRYAAINDVLPRGVRTSMHIHRPLRSMMGFPTTLCRHLLWRRSTMPPRSLGDSVHAEVIVYGKYTSTFARC